MKTAHIRLPTIHCESCTKLIGMTLKNIPGIKNKIFDTDKKSLIVEFDSSTTSQAIVDAIVSDAGYEATLESEEDTESEASLSRDDHIIPIPPARSEGSKISENNASIATFEIS